MARKVDGQWTNGRKEWIMEWTIKPGNEGNGRITHRSWP